jgi:Zn-dependent peptidase ImmA (M78 family)
MVQPALPSPLSNQAISEYASRIGSHYGIYDEFGRADVEKLVEALGGRIRTAREVFSPEALSVYAPGSFDIYLPPITSSRRDRFTVAHEIGHYFLHYVHPGISTPMTFGRGSRNRAETQANYFAAALLMPEAAFREARRRVGDDWWALSETFGVSPSAAEVRAQVVGPG